MVIQPTNVVTRSLDGDEPARRVADHEEAAALAAALREEMIAAWRRGEHPAAEEFLVRLPDLPCHVSAAVQLIYQEIHLRREYGEAQASEAVVRRFPQWQAELRALLTREQPAILGPQTPTFPEAGDSLGDFQLRAELGRGALGRVFLASQASLADRPVVLKATPCHGHEHLSLARLQHTHIVPLWWVQNYPARNLRVLCMPYLGGTALSGLLERLTSRSPSERTGLQLLQALEQVQAEAPLPLPVAGPAAQFLARASYSQAICWIGVCLAEALQYAHERSLLHLDLKPSNVLIAADGTPMLLDFHLARAPLACGTPAPDWLGGTPLYMSPEQKAALTAVRNQERIGVAVDGRSDICSLGLLLYEALAGRLPALEPTPLHRLNPQVSVGLSDIIHRCLRPDPRDRYPSAAALAQDLCLHLKDQPLRGVRNRSWHERWAKWRRRRPHALVVGTLLLAVGAALVTVALLVRGHFAQQRGQAEQTLADGRRQLAAAEYAAANRTLTRGLGLSESLPHSSELKQSLALELRRARRGQAALELHTVADQLRFLVDPEALPRSERRALEARCRTVWSTRQLVLDRAGAELPEAVERSLQDDLLDLAVLWADLAVQLTPASSVAAVQQESLAVLVEAEQLLGRSPALFREQQSLAQALGRGDGGVTAPPPRTPWDHYALARWLLRRGETRAAAAALEQAVALQPQSFWPNFYLGVCAHRQGEPEEAVRAFSICIALRPDSAVCWANRALAWTAHGRPDRALRDYDRALQLQPLAAAALNRGILHYQERRFDLARADLQRALASGAEPGTVYYNLALIELAQDNRAGALWSLQLAVRHQPDHLPARDLRDRLLRTTGSP
jgi:serine/threonine protein kinase/tetratricopeptide (TPR) repeat protein